MNKRFLTVAAMAALALAFSPKTFAAVDEELTITVGTGITAVTATIELATTGPPASGTLSVTCGGTATQCGDLQNQSGGPLLGGSLADGSSISDSGQDKTLSVTNVVFDGYTISDTATGWAASSAPTLQTFNNVVALGGAGLVTSEFTDIDYNTPGTPLSSEFNVADSNVTDSQISASTVNFTVLSGAANAIPASSLIYTNQLTGESDSNGAGGAIAANPNTTGSVSISSEAVLSFTGTGKIQANVSVSNVAVPEPASVVFLGTIMLGLTALIRKRQVRRS